MPADFSLWLLVFVRITTLLAVFPILSSPSCPARLRVALGAIAAFLVAASLPASLPAPAHVGDLFVALVGEALIGLLLGFVSRLLFYALDLAGGLIAAEMGLLFTPDIDPFSQTETQAPGLVLYLLAAMLFFSLDLHHLFLVAFQRSYAVLPLAGAHWREPLLADLIQRTGQTFVLALQMSAPILAVAFIITWVFAVIGRAVPQMNVFFESFSVRILAGLAVFGLTLNLIAQHVVRWFDHLPDDLLRVAQILGAR